MPFFRGNIVDGLGAFSYVRYIIKDLLIGPEFGFVIGFIVQYFMNFPSIRRRRFLSYC